MDVDDVVRSKICRGTRGERSLSLHFGENRISYDSRNERKFAALSIFFTVWPFPAVALTELSPGKDRGIAILVYYRFGPKVVTA
jgi:hypothetical protein